MKRRHHIQTIILATGITLAAYGVQAPESGEIALTSKGTKKLAVGEGIIVRPFDETVFVAGNTDRTILFEGYATQPGTSVELEAFDTNGARWEVFASTSASARRSVPKNTYGVPSGPRYFFSVSAQIRPNPIELGRWPDNGWARVRARERVGKIWLLIATAHDQDHLDCIVAAPVPFEIAWTNCIGLPSVDTTLDLNDID